MNLRAVDAEVEDLVAPTVEPDRTAVRSLVEGAGLSRDYSERPELGLKGLERDPSAGLAALREESRVEGCPERAGLGTAGCRFRLPYTAILVGG